MKANILLAGALFITGNAMAADDSIPEICKAAANYTAQSMALQFSDGSFSDKQDPAKVLIKKDYENFPITKEEVLGGCEETDTLPSNWCRVAGGSPVVYQMEVGKKDQYDKKVYPYVTVVVTFNRGGCWVDKAEIK